MPTIADIRKDVIHIRNELLKVKEDRKALEGLANEIADEYRANPIIIRAIWLWTIPTTLELNNQSKEFIRDYVALTLIKNEKKKRRLEMCTLFNTPLKVIAPVTAHTEIRVKRALKKQGQKKTENNISKISRKKPDNVDQNPKWPKAEVKPITQVWVPNDNKQLLNTGTLKLEWWAHIDYNNEIKIKWRKKLKEFLLERTTPKERRKMKVLCLPWKMWHEVIEIYLDLWFMPENIIWFEKDESAIPDFISNKPKWCRHETVDINKYLKTTSEEFDVISLDLLWPMSPAYEEIFKNIIPWKKMYLLVNMMWKREQKIMQTRMQELDWIARSIGKAVTWSWIFAAFNWTQSRINDWINNHREISSVRNESLALHLQGIIWMNRKYTNLFSNAINKLPNLKWLEDKSKVDLVINLSLYMLNSIETLLIDSNVPRASNFWINMHWLLNRCLRHNPFVTHIKKYKYISRVWKTSSPFVSDLLELTVPEDIFYSSKNTIMFFINCLKHYIPMFENWFDWKTWFFSISRKWVIKKTCTPTNDSDRIAFMSNGKVLTELKYGIFLKDIRRYAAFRTNNESEIYTNKLASSYREEIKL